MIPECVCVCVGPPRVPPRIRTEPSLRRARGQDQSPRRAGGARAAPPTESHKLAKSLLLFCPRTAAPSKNLAEQRPVLAQHHTTPGGEGFGLGATFALI